MIKPTLLVLAAGMGSRYGSLKQMDGVGPNGEAIIDYSVYDAIRAGFGKVVFVQSQSGFMYVYTGLSDTSVSKGEYVSTGKQLGIVGVDSFTGKSQLTFMVFQDGIPIDPAQAPRG